MAPKENQTGKRMWPSLPVANKVADIANFFFIGSLVVGVISTILIVWMTGVKERYWDADRQQSTERIAALITQGDQLRKDTAEANARASEAQLALARFKAPRSIADSDTSTLIAALSKYSGTDAAIYILGDGPEPTGLAGAIGHVLSLAHWKPLIWTWSGAGSATGVVVLFKSGSSAEIEAICDGLVSALNAAHIDAVKEPWPGDWEHFGGMLNGPNPPSPTAAPIRIVIGTKPQ